MGIGQRLAARADRAEGVPCRAPDRTGAGGDAAPPSRSGAPAGRLAVLALCAILALPAALAVPLYDGGIGEVGHLSWLQGQGAGGTWLAILAHAQTTDSDLSIDNLVNSAVLIAPNQLNISYTKNAGANADLSMSYMVAMDPDDLDLNDDYDLRNVTGIDGNGTTVHTLTFDGPPVAKNAADKGIYVGRITNASNVLWSGWSQDWADPSLFGYEPVADAQRPAVVSAKLTSNTTLSVAYDEPVSYTTPDDYSITLAGGGNVAVTSVVGGDGFAIAASEATMQHVLGLNSHVSLDEISMLAINASNVKDASQYLVGGTFVIGNTLLDNQVMVGDGIAPRPIRAEIVGPLQINVTFSEPVNSSPANYEAITIASDYLPFDARSRTVTAVVAGNGTATHTLMLNTTDEPIPLVPTGSVTTGVVGVVGVTDLNGNTMLGIEDIPITDARNTDGAPWMIAARFTGYNEVTVSYNASAWVPDGGYSVLASAASMPYAPADSKFEYVWNYTNTRYNGTFVKLDIVDVEGNGTALHKLTINGSSGVGRSAYGLINVTGLAQLDNAPVGRNYTNEFVYDEQLPRVVSARITGDRTVVVEYDQPTVGPLSGYQKVVVYDNDGQPTEVDVSMVRTGSMSTLGRSFSQPVVLDKVNIVGYRGDWYNPIADDVGPVRGGGDGSYVGRLLLSNGTEIFVQVVDLEKSSFELEDWVNSTTRGWAGGGKWHAANWNNSASEYYVVVHKNQWLVMSNEVGTLAGIEHLNIHSSETATECWLYSTPFGDVLQKPTSVNNTSPLFTSQCLRQQMPGTHHMITLAEDIPDNMRSSLVITADVTGSNGALGTNSDPIANIGVAYRGADAYLYDQQYINNTSPANVVLLGSALVDISSLSAGSYIPTTNPYIHILSDHMVLQLYLNEAVDVSSIDFSKVSIPMRWNGTLYDYRPDKNSEVITINGSERIGIKITGMTSYIPVPVLALQWGNYTGYNEDIDLDRNKNANIITMLPSNTTIDYSTLLREALLNHTVSGGYQGLRVNIQQGFAANANGDTIGFGNYPAAVGMDPFPAPDTVRLRFASITSGNNITINYTGAVDADASDYTGLELAPGGSRAVMSVSGSGTAEHVLVFNGTAAAAGATGTIDIGQLDNPDGYVAFAGAVNQKIGGDGSIAETSMRAGLESIKSAQGMLTATYTSPVDAAIDDYTIRLQENNQTVAITNITGSGSKIHMVEHEVLSNGTWVLVTISALDDEGSGYTYEGTSQPLAVLATSDGRSATPATLTRIASNGIALEADYTHPIDTHDASQRVNGTIPPAAYHYAITYENGTVIPIAGVSANGATTHVIGHAPLPNGTKMLVSVRAHSTEAGGAWFEGIVNEPVTVDVNATIAPPVVVQPTRTEVEVLADAQFISSNKAVISYTGPLDGPRDAYGRVTSEAGLDAPTIAVTGWGTEAHTVTFNGSVAEMQAGEIALNKDLEGIKGNITYTFTNDTIPVQALSRTITLQDSGTVEIVRDSIVSEVTTRGNDTARIGINITGLSDTPLVSDPANNTVRFPDSRNITVTTTFAQVVIPPNATAMSVPADGNLELYVVSGNERPEADDVIAALDLGNNSVRIGKIVEIGDSETHITFTIPVRILLEGQAGGRAFYMNNSDDAVMPINTMCRADSTSEVHDQLNGTGECQLDSGDDKVIHTYHLTRFGTVTLVDMKTHTMVVTVMPKPTGGNGGTGTVPPPVVVPTPGRDGTGQPGTTFFGGGGGGGRGGGGGGGGGSIIPTGSGGPVLYSASWDCDDGTVRMAVNDGMRSPDIVVVSSTGTVPATLADVQDMSGRTIYEAPLPTDGIFSIRATAVDGRTVSSVSESIRTGGACTGETVFRQYAPGDGTAQPAGMSVEDITGGEPAPAREPADDQQRQPDAPAEPEQPADSTAADAEPELVRPAFEIEEGRDASYYVKRYAEQPAYREWFDSSYPQYADICEAVGVASGCVEAHLAGKAVEPVDGMDGAADADADREPSTGTAAPADDDSGCLIATAAYGTELAPQVQALREYRDGTLLATGSGSAFMSTFSSAYYAFSPQVADLEREHPALRQAVAALMTPMLYTLQVATHADPASEDSVLAYGIAAMLLVSVVYAGVPAAGAVAVAWAVRRRRRARRTAA